MSHDSAKVLAGSILLLAAAVLIAAGFGENVGHRQELSLMFGIPVGIVGIIFLLFGGFSSGSHEQ